MSWPLGATARPRRAAGAGRVGAWVHGALTSDENATEVATTAAEALALGWGVCQDSAHIMLTVCRLAGLPAGYVSGHLLGQGGSHAWVEVVLDDGAGCEVLAVDPATGGRPGRAT